MGEPKAETLDGLIAGVYDAATGDHCWQEWFEAAASRFGATSGLLSVHDTRTGAAAALAAHNFSDRALQKYDAYYHRVDLWRHRAFAKMMRPVDRSRLPVFLSEDLVTDDEYARSEGYTDYAKPELGGAFYLVCAGFAVGSDQFFGLGMHQPRDAGPFTAAQRRMMEVLYPHLHRALAIRSRLTRAEGERLASQAALEAISHGIMLVSRDGRVIFANRAAETIAARRDGIAIGVKGALTAARPAQTEELTRLIAGCALPAGGGVLRLPRPSGRRPLEAIVAPLGPRGRDTISGAAVAIVFLRDPETQPRLMADVLQKLYGLTRAEGRLAADLVAHRRLEEIAEARSVSRETVRSQLKELFRKTGTCRQAELVSFLVSGLAHVASPHEADGASR